MTAQVATQPISVFTAAIAQINGAVVNGEVLPDTGNQAGAASFRMLIDSMLGQRIDEAPNTIAEQALPAQIISNMLAQHNGGGSNTIAHQTLQEQLISSAINQHVGEVPNTIADQPLLGQLISSMLGQHNGEPPNPAADQTLQEVLAEESQDDIAAELAAIMPFLAAFGLTAADVKPPNTDNLTDIETRETGSQLLGALTASNVSKENSAATAITAGANAFAADDPIQLLMARHAGVNQQEGIGTVEPAFRQPEQPGPSFSSIQQAMQSAASPAQSNAPTASHSLPTPVGAGNWGEDFANRVVWMANRLESRADLVLTPPQMGRIEVSLSITGDQATANFVSGNPAVREALEAALPRLREVLADAGIQLGQTQVGAGNPQQTAQHEKNGENSAFGRPSLANDSRNMSDEEARTGSLSSFSGDSAGRGLVDVFA